MTSSRHTLPLDVVQTQSWQCTVKILNIASAHQEQQEPFNLCLSEQLWDLEDIRDRDSRSTSERNKENISRTPSSSDALNYMLTSVHGHAVTVAEWPFYLENLIENLFELLKTTPYVKIRIVFYLIRQFLLLLIECIFIWLSFCGSEPAAAVAE